MEKMLSNTRDDDVLLFVIDDNETDFIELSTSKQICKILVETSNPAQLFLIIETASRNFINPAFQNADDKT